MGGQDSHRRGPKVGYLVGLVAALVVAVIGLRVGTNSSPHVATATPIVATEPSVPVTSTTPAVPSPPIHPSHVMVIGDSGTWDMYPAFEQGFAAAGVTVSSAAFPGEGLTTPAGIRHLWYDAAEWWHADYFVVSIGTWDDAFIAWHGWDAYLDEIDETVRTLTKHGGHVLWLSMMPSDDPEPDAHAKPRLQDRLYASLPSRYPGVVEYLDIGPALTAPDGTSPRTLDGRLLRKPDGWHLCPDGAAAVAHAVLAHLGLDSVGWDSGTWRRDPRYDDPPGACRRR
ncbi:MAG TPA: SGNH/GDSL hydrolase family protein [Acidimicrobiales bacterium]|nr:SGNH/GDSL hydrolase family protein [Acidimicrobiales bacterium]